MGLATNSLTDQALSIVTRHGNLALQLACRLISESHYTDETVDSTAKYYAQETLSRVLPIFPALLHLSCSAAGGDTRKVDSVAPALMIITAAGDIHDDVIDRSKRKCGRQTVFGKFGKDVALLLGDAFLVQGLTLLDGCSNLTSSQRKSIFCLTEKSLYESIGAELIETRLWVKKDVEPQEYFEVIKRKGSVAELQSRIGGLLADADEQTLNELAHFGRAIGILSSVKDEFMDMQNFPELKNRIKHELPPYPIICAAKNPKLKQVMGPVLERKAPLRKDLETLSKLVLESGEVRSLRAEMAQLGNKELARNRLLKNEEKAGEARVLLLALATEL